MRDHHRGHQFHVWTRRDEFLGWSWCFAIDESSTTCTEDASFSTEAMALVNGEAAARATIDKRDPDPNWRRWIRQRFSP